MMPGLATCEIKEEMGMFHSDMSCWRMVVSAVACYGATSWVIEEKVQSRHEAAGVDHVIGPLSHPLIVSQ